MKVNLANEPPLPVSEVGDTASLLHDQPMKNTKTIDKINKNLRIVFYFKIVKNAVFTEGVSMSDLSCRISVVYEPNGQFNAFGSI